jgi:hypothetical protein
VKEPKDGDTSKEIDQPKDGDTSKELDQEDLTPNKEKS